jgi:hypothetical protein
MTGGAKLEEEARVDAGLNQKRLFVSNPTGKFISSLAAAAAGISLSFSSAQKLGG